MIFSKEQWNRIVNQLRTRADAILVIDKYLHTKVYRLEDNIPWVMYAGNEQN
jgi:hypothetical protein